MNKTFAFVAVAVLAVAGQPAIAEAQVRIGPQVSYADDFELGLGARAEMDFTELFGVDEGFFANVFGIAAFDYYLDCGAGDCSAFEITANAAYAFPTEGAARPYAGTGLSFQRVSFDTGLGSASDTELAIDLMGGLKFPLGGVTGFGEVRLQPNGYEQFSVQLGVLFGG